MTLESGKSRVLSHRPRIAGLPCSLLAPATAQMPRVFIRRLERGAGHTCTVESPEELDHHIAHGDTDGPCPHHEE